MKQAISLIFSLLLLAACAVPAFAAEGSYANFQEVAEYIDGLFDDVTDDDWYRDNVAAAYALGLMRGDGDGSFNAAGSVRVSEAVVMAARVHSIYLTGKAEFEQGEPWYRVYADYALEHSLLGAEPEDYDAAVTRREFAAILARALPASALPAINDVADDRIPDVKMTSENAEEIYRLYRAGVLTGNNSRGAFTPSAQIRRSDAAAIVTRMAYRSLRQKYTLESATWPDLYEQPAADGSFFSDAAMLGNSLVDGMKLYSGLNMDFYGQTSATVYNNTLDSLLQKRYGKVYIEFGINEIGGTTEAVTAKYGEIIDSIRAVMPDAEIYVMAVTPVTKARSDAGSFTMTRINALNAALYDMCGKKECWYLDCCTLLEDDAGYLVEDYAGWDGSPHLGAAGYAAWTEIIRTYYA